MSKDVRSRVVANLVYMYSERDPAEIPQGATGAEVFGTRDTEPSFLQGKPSSASRHVQAPPEGIMTHMDT